MRSDRLVSILLLCATIVFAGRFLSRSSPRATRICMRMSSPFRVVMCDSDAAREAGQWMLNKGEKDSGLVLLTRALESNPLNPDIYLLLGRSRLYEEDIENRAFEQGLLELRTAARLGRSRDSIAAETGMQLLALWPILDEKARKECERLLIRGVRVIETDALVSTWWRYSRNRSLLASVLESRPEVMRIAADTLTRMGAPLEWRWRLLAANERLEYADLRRKYRGYRNNRTRLEELERRMKAILGYGTLLDSNDPDWPRYRIFRERLLLEALENAEQQFRHHPGPQTRETTITLLRRVLEETKNVDLIPIEGLLAGTALWDAENKPDDSLLRARLYMRTGNYSRAMELSVATAESRKDQTGAYFEARLLATRAAMAMKLMIAARGQVRMILDQDPGHLEANCLMGSILRELRQDIPDGEAERIRKGCQLNLSSGRLERRIPLFPGVNPEIRVPAGRPGQKRLLHLRMDGQVVLERYLSGEGELVSIPMAGDRLDAGEMIHVSVLLTDIKENG